MYLKMNQIHIVYQRVHIYWNKYGEKIGLFRESFVCEIGNTFSYFT